MFGRKKSIDTVNLGENSCCVCGANIREIPYRGLLVKHENKNANLNTISNIDCHFFPPCWNTANFEKMFPLTDYLIMAYLETMSEEQVKEFAGEWKHEKLKEKWQCETSVILIDIKAKKSSAIIVNPASSWQEIKSFFSS